ncbi:hypothetical protein ACWCQZ_50540 [Streptomyces sp. NPDC002285]
MVTYAARLDVPRHVVDRLEPPRMRLSRDGETLGRHTVWHRLHPAELHAR